MQPLCLLHRGLAEHDQPVALAVPGPAARLEPQARVEPHRGLVLRPDFQADRPGAQPVEPAKPEGAERPGDAPALKLRVDCDGENPGLGLDLRLTGAGQEIQFVERQRSYRCHSNAILSADPPPEPPEDDAPAKRHPADAAGGRRGKEIPGDPSVAVFGDIQGLRLRGQAECEGLRHYRRGGRGIKVMSD